MTWWPFRQRPPANDSLSLDDYLTASRAQDTARRLALTAAAQGMLEMLARIEGLARLEEISAIHASTLLPAERDRLLAQITQARAATHAILTELGVELPVQDIRHAIRSELRGLSDEQGELRDRFTAGYGPPVPEITEQLVQHLHTLSALLADLNMALGPLPDALSKTARAEAE